MTRKVTSYRLPELTLNQIKQLTESTGSSDANVIAFAIDRMYQQEIIMNNTLFVPLDAAKGPYPQIIEGQSVYGYDGKYWIGHISFRSDGRRLKLTPVTDEQRTYLDKNYAFIIDGKP